MQNITHAEHLDLQAARYGFPEIRKREEPTRQVSALVALNRLNKPMYQGTVPGSIKQARRRKNKAARHARRVHRG